LSVSLEELWRRAAVAGVDPAIEELLSALPAWDDVVALPSDALDERLGRLFDTHRLAIAHSDLDALRALELRWRSAPALIDSLRVLRARGEIDLGLGGRGWTPAELEMLVNESFLVVGVPTEDAWRALALGDVGSARSALERGRAVSSAGASPLMWPGVVLGVELRALRALCARDD
jgi:hypothetical protein